MNGCESLIASLQASCEAEIARLNTPGCDATKAWVMPASLDDVLALVETAEAATAFVATTSVFRQRKDSRDAFERLALALQKVRDA